MQRLDTDFKGIVRSRSETTGVLKSPGDAVLVERGRPRVLVMVCPCGCGEELAINVDPQAGPAWRLYSAARRITVFPSIWRDSGCESHFIVWNGTIYLFGRYIGRDADEQDPVLSHDDRVSKHDVLAALSREQFDSVDTIADRLGVIPWEILWICRDLVRDGLAIEGRGKNRTQFRRK